MLLASKLTSHGIVSFSEDGERIAEQDSLIASLRSEYQNLSGTKSDIEQDHTTALEIQQANAGRQFMSCQEMGSGASIWFEAHFFDISGIKYERAATRYETRAIRGHYTRCRVSYAMLSKTTSIEYSTASELTRRNCPRATRNLPLSLTPDALDFCSVLNNRKHKTALHCRMWSKRMNLAYLGRKCCSFTSSRGASDASAQSWAELDQYQSNPERQGLWRSDDENASNTRTELAVLEARSPWAELARAMQEQSASMQNSTSGSSGAFNSLQAQATPQADFGWEFAAESKTYEAQQHFEAQQDFEEPSEITYTQDQPAAIQGPAMNFPFGTQLGQHSLRPEAITQTWTNSSMPLLPYNVNAQLPLPPFDPSLAGSSLTSSPSANLPRSLPSLPALSSRKARRGGKGEPMQQSTSAASIQNSQVSVRKISGPRHSRAKDDYSVEAFRGLTAAEILLGGKDGIRIQSHDIDGPVILKVAECFTNEEIHYFINRLRDQERLEAQSYGSTTKRITNSLKACARGDGYTSKADLDEFVQVWRDLRVEEFAKIGKTGNAVIPRNLFFNAPAPVDPWAAFFSQVPFNPQLPFDPQLPFGQDLPFDQLTSEQFTHPSTLYPQPASLTGSNSFPAGLLSTSSPLAPQPSNLTRLTERGEPTRRSTSNASSHSKKASRVRANGSKRYPRHLRDTDDYKVEAFDQLTATEILNGGNRRVRVRSHEIDGPAIIKVALELSNEQIYAYVNRLLCQEGFEPKERTNGLNMITKRISNSLKDWTAKEGFVSAAEANKFMEDWRELRIRKMAGIGITGNAINPRNPQKMSANAKGRQSKPRTGLAPAQ
ncbi:uncharacterized protein MYCFIDRAFT_81838 [Pseudocercospora fijiensis CIRAD86]|uniref:Uncharacterized protein n=1 Tax=Pseudocercospora fijiensis (strain CIRAD86) TaxID=383855 RepID=M3B958_PSEFD|nr:uncharacterized protein MYCFIDRAFT_81838 [Pseudocercospora fijiensis CIRAD86]EME85867.1 hypothetical protein MYCFIDRAFT_81838 [Pseudocercospora fijiensis CIRAD86]